MGRIGFRSRERMHRLFTELIPGGAPVKKTTAQYRALLAGVRPWDLAGKTRRRMAAEEIADLEHLDAKLKEMKAELKAAVLASGSHLMDIHGIGPAGAARILGDVARFPNRARFASWTGTAPIDASSGQHTHHRLSRAGNRRWHGEGRDAGGRDFRPWRMGLVSLRAACAGLLACRAWACPRK